MNKRLVAAAAAHVAVHIRGGALVDLHKDAVTLGCPKPRALNLLKRGREPLFEHVELSCLVLQVSNTYRGSKPSIGCSKPSILVILMLFSE